MSRIKTHTTKSLETALLVCKEKLSLHSQFTVEFDEVGKGWNISYPLCNRDDLPRTIPKEVI